MTEAQELKAAAIRDARQKIASGEWSITPSQLAMFRKLSARLPQVKASHFEVSTIKNALASLLQASRSQDLPTVLSLVMDAIGDLRSLEPSKVVGEKAGGETLSVRDAITEIAKRQAKQEAAVDQRERVVAKLLADAPLPQAPDPEKLAAQAVREAMKKVDAEVRPDAKESPETTRLKRKLADELNRGKRR